MRSAISSSRRRNIQYRSERSSRLHRDVGARTTDVEPAVVASTLIGFHRSLVDFVRRGSLAGTPNAKLARELRRQASAALAVLEHGLGDYGLK
jgi:hypothetical protein